MNENKTILVTGGAGAIGSNLVNTIIDDCEKLIILDDFSSGRSDNLEYLNSEKVHIVDGDICNQSTIDEAFSYAKQFDQPVLLSYFSHDHRDMRPETYRAIEMIQKSSNKFGVPFSYCDAKSAFWQTYVARCA